MGAKHCHEHVCLCVYPLAYFSSKLPVAMAWPSRWYCNALSTFVFVQDVSLLHTKGPTVPSNGENWRTKIMQWLSIQILLSDNDQQAHIADYTHTEVCCQCLSCLICNEPVLWSLILRVKVYCNFAWCHFLKVCYASLCCIVVLNKTLKTISATRKIDVCRLI